MKCSCLASGLTPAQYSSERHSSARRVWPSGRRNRGNRGALARASQPNLADLKGHWLGILWTIRLHQLCRHLRSTDQGARQVTQQRLAVLGLLAAVHTTTMDQSPVSIYNGVLGC